MLARGRGQRRAAVGPSSPGGSDGWPQLSVGRPPPHRRGEQPPLRAAARFRFFLGRHPTPPATLAGAPVTALAVEARESVRRRGGAQANGGKFHRPRRLLGAREQQRHRHRSVEVHRDANDVRVHPRPVPAPLPPSPCHCHDGPHPRRQSPPAPTIRGRSSRAPQAPGDDAALGMPSLVRAEGQRKNPTGAADGGVAGTRACTADKVCGATTRGAVERASGLPLVPSSGSEASQMVAEEAWRPRARRRAGRCSGGVAARSGARAPRRRYRTGARRRVLPEVRERRR